MTNHQRRFRLTCLAAALIVGGFSSAKADVIRVLVSNYTFIPQQIVAHVGDTIQWVSTDFVPHTATGRNVTWELPIPAGLSGAIILTGPGTLDYYCRYHPHMTGSIKILGARVR